MTDQKDRGHYAEAEGDEQEAGRNAHQNEFTYESSEEEDLDEEEVNKKGVDLHDRQAKIMNDQKGQLQVVVVFLCAGIAFGNSFCGNSQSPLQQEIEAFMNIDDSQFNLMFSARAMSSLVFPFMLPWSMQKLGTRYTMYIIVACATLGQYIFIKGLREKNYFHCLVSRVVFGVSDLVTIMQNVIMCMWFTPSQLPVAFSLLLFMVKLVRAINDNVASMVYNHYQNLEIFFKMGQCVCIFSMLAAIALVEIHYFYIESGKNQQKEGKKDKERKDERPKFNIKKQAESSLASPPVLTIVGMYLVCNSVLHSFYPNFSKFMQQNYGFSNTLAGHMSSIPYLVASVTVPICGQLISHFGPPAYEAFFRSAMLCIIAAHSGFLVLSMQSAPKADNAYYKVLPDYLFYPLVILCLLLTAGHAMMTTLQTPAASKYITDKTDQTKFFSYIKIGEGIVISCCMYLYGFIRQKTGSYTEMSLLLIVIAVAGYALACYLQNLAREIDIMSPGEGAKRGVEDQVGLQKKMQDGQQQSEQGLQMQALKSSPSKGKDKRRADKAKTVKTYAGKLEIMEEELAEGENTEIVVDDEESQHLYKRHKGPKTMNYRQ